MLQVLRRPRTTPGRQMLQENIGYSVKKDYKGLGKFSRWYFGSPAYNIGRWLDIPCPSEIGEASEPSP